MWQLPYTTHSNLLNLISNQEPVAIQIHRTFFKFVCSLFKTNNDYANRCQHMAIHGSMSKVSNSINYLSYKYSFDKSIFLQKNSVNHCNNIISYSPEEIDCIISGKSDLCYIRDTKTSHFSNYEIEVMITAQVSL